MTTSIFINYRRDVDGGFAGRIYDRLCQCFAGQEIFFDIDGIRPGLDFEEVIHREIVGAKLVVVVIGPRWLDCGSEHGKRRIDQPDDFVRVEIETALSLGKLLLPVLVDDAEMPSARLLPASLAGLGKRNAVHVRHHSFARDVGGLVTSIEWLLERGHVGTDTTMRAQRADKNVVPAQPNAEGSTNIGRDAKQRDVAHHTAEESTRWQSAQSGISSFDVSPSWQPLHDRPRRNPPAKGKS